MQNDTNHSVVLVNQPSCNSICTQSKLEQNNPNLHCTLKFRLKNRNAESFRSKLPFLWLQFCLKHQLMSKLNLQLSSCLNHALNSQLKKVNAWSGTQVPIGDVEVNEQSEWEEARVHSLFNT